MERIAVLGLGNWGTALAHHLAAKGFDVLGWTVDRESVESINRNHVNSLYLKGLPLDPRLKATLNLEELGDRAFVVCAVPSAYLGNVIPKLKLPKGAILVSGTKGLEHDSLLTPLQYIARLVDASVRLAVLSGPSFAIDVVRHKPVGLVAASNDENTARQAAEAFGSDWMRVYLSHDPLGVELGGVVKNVIALAAGICDGLDFGDSAQAGLVTRGLAEMTRLAVAMGAERQTLSGLSGLGDLAMTASSNTSRNRTVGVRLGKGEALPYILQTLGSVAEGVTTTPLLLKLGERHGVELPITQGVAQVLAGKISPQEMAKALISRPIKKEF